MESELSPVAMELLVFDAARNWQPFHAPKSHETALAVEATALLERSQRLNQGQPPAMGPERLQAVSEVVGYEQGYRIRLVDRLEMETPHGVLQQRECDLQKQPESESPKPKLP